MKEAIDVYNQLRAIVRKPENYVPRNYQTIGGRWTTDTYKLGEVTLHMMDEGYSSRLFGPGFDVSEVYRNDGDVIEFKQGGLDELKAVIADENHSPRPSGPSGTDDTAQQVREQTGEALP